MNPRSDLHTFDHLPFLAAITLFFLGGLLGFLTHGWLTIG
ncbi:Secretion system apparatus protein ssaU [Yersinia aldovae ATCC 35236]|nr:Secretion system apparatus protein ssaU [Yersinia aldovae ATCC 35236]